MITLSEHIDELCAERRRCLNHRDRTTIPVELNAAIAALKQQDLAAAADRPSG